MKTLEEQTDEVEEMIDGKGDGYQWANHVCDLLRQWQERCEKAEAEREVLRINNTPSLQPIFEAGWFMPLDSMSDLAQESFIKMMKVICHGGRADVVARVDGKEYRWQCDGLKYARLIPPMKTEELETLSNAVEQNTALQQRMERMRGTINSFEEIAEIFDAYAQMHLAKSPPDEIKATRNKYYAAQCRVRIKQALADDSPTEAGEG